MNMDTRVINFDTLLWLRDGVESIGESNTEMAALYTIFDRIIAQTKLEMISL